MKKVILIINSKSRQGAKAKDALVAALNARGIQIINSLDPTVAQPFPETIRQCQNGADAVIVAGGDGSVNACLPALIESGLPLLLVPQGTANNLAVTLKIPVNIEAAVSLLETASTTTIDLGMANEIPFVNLIGIGLSTRINRAVPAGLKRWLGPIAFLITCARVLKSMVPFHIHITVDGKRHRAWSWQVTVCNGKYYGNHLAIHEDATLFDQKLNGLSTETEKWWHGFRLIPGFIKGRFKKSDPVWQFEGTDIYIEGHRPMAVDIDGDIKTRTPVRVGVLPKALQIFVPPHPPAS